jgi:hypothetical protein
LDGSVNRDLQRYAAFDFGGGLDVKTSPLALAMRKVQDRLIKADNMVYTISKAVTKRFAYDKYNTNSLGANVAITGGIQFRRSDGTDFTLAGTDDGRLVKFDVGGTTSNVTTGLATGRRWSMDVYNDKVIAVNGSDTPKKWDGTTLADLGGTPPAKASMVVVHSNRVFMLDETLTSRLTWSALNNEEDYVSATNAGTMLVDPNNSARLTGMVSASKSELILAKPNKIYRLQGTQPATYSVTNLLPTLAGAGNLSFQGMVYALNDVYMVASDGVHQLRTVLEFGDLKVAYASERIDPYFQPHTDFTLASQHLDLSVACYDRENSRIYFAVDSDGDAKNDLVLVYDVALTCWSLWPGIGVASMWIGRNASTGENEVFAGGYDGFVRRFNSPSGSTDAIAGEVRHISNLNAPGIEKSPRHLFVYLKEQGNYNVTVDTKFDFGATGGQVYSVSLLGNAHTLGVNWVLGVDPLGAKKQIVKRLDLSGIGEYLELGFKNLNANQPFTLQGYEVMWRPRRLVRRGA